MLLADRDEGVPRFDDIAYAAAGIGTAAGRRTARRRVSGCGAASSDIFRVVLVGRELYDLTGTQRIELLFAGEAVELHYCGLDVIVVHAVAAADGNQCVAAFYRVADNISFGIGRRHQSGEQCDHKEQT